MTPGTLSVRATKRVDAHQELVPQISLNASQFANLENVGEKMYKSAGTDISRIAFGSMTSGGVLPISSNYQNMSYSLHFHAPALRCSPANGSDNDAFQPVINNTAAAGSVLEFTAWVPSDPVHQYLSNVTGLNLNVTQPFRSVDSGSDVARLFLFSASSNGYAPTEYNPQLIECKFQNATYTVDFLFKYPDQTVSVRHLEYLGDFGASDSAEDYFINELSKGVIGPESEKLSYLAMTDAFSKVMVGYKEMSHYGYSEIYYSLFPYTRVDWLGSDTRTETLQEMFTNFTLSMFTCSSLL